MDLLKLYENCELQGKEKLDYINSNGYTFNSIDSLRTKIKNLRKKTGIRPGNGQIYAPTETKEKIKELQNKIKQNSDIQHTIKLDLELDKHKKHKDIVEKKYEALKNEYDILQSQLEVLLELKDAEYQEIKIDTIERIKSESTAILCLSDYHFEETVEGYSVDGLNEYNPEIAKKRGLNFFKNGLKVVNNLREENNIKDVVIWLGGDLISGYLHPELEENNPLSPTEALLEVKNIIINGINHFLSNSNYNLTIPCSYGNHGRTTKDVRHSSGYKNSYEYMLYKILEDNYRDNPRVKFQVAKGYFNYLSIYNIKIVFHHGNNVRFGGGVGGITIPMNKAISQWRKAKHSDIFVCGHFHQILFAKDFVVNGSVIGYNAYAQSIKAEYEIPAQAGFLLNSKYGRSIDFRIYLD